MTDIAYGQCPVLEVDGKVLSQSGAMERYVAKLVGMYPVDPWEAAKVRGGVHVGETYPFTCHYLCQSCGLHACALVCGKREGC